MPPQPSLKVKGWPAPPRGCELLESLSRGCGQLRYLLGETRSLEAAVCQWEAMDGDDSHSAGLWAHPRRPASLAGRGWQRLVCGGLSSVEREPRSQLEPRTESKSAREGPGWRERAAARSGARPSCSRNLGRSLFLEQRQALRGRGQERGGDHRHWNTGTGRRGGRTPVAVWAAATGAGTLPREHLSPGPRVSWPRSPRPPPIQRPASSRPGSPGNH